MSKAYKNIQIKSEWRLFDYFANNFNSASHALGVVIALIGLVALSYLSHGKPDYFVGALAFCLSAALLFGASALMHFMTESFNLSQKLTFFLKDLDHSAIFLLIAGSYTPVMMTALDEPLRSRMLILVWSIAVAGILFTQFRRRLPLMFRNRFFQVANYLAMGWLALMCVGELYANLSGPVFSLIVAEAIFYSVGALVYAFKWPNPKPPYFAFHQLWHIFVLMGFVCHLCALLILYK